MINKLLCASQMLILITFILYSTKYNVDQSRENRVKFISYAPMENYEGVTSNIEGFIFYEGDEMDGKSSLFFEVDLRTVDTGIRLRNKYLKETLLDSEKYPYATFKGELLSVEKETAKQYKVVADGKLTLNGYTREIRTEGKLVKSGNGYKIASGFSLKLSDYGIEIPKGMLMKISDRIDLVLDFYIAKKRYPL